MPVNRPMKRLSLYLFLILFTLQTPSQADDIRDFQIEGMSIGDSLLDFYSEAKIKSNKKNWYKNKDVTGVEIIEKKGLYDSIQFHFKADDKNFTIIGIKGLIFYKNNNIEDCYKKQKEVSEELKQVFPNTKIILGTKISHPSDKTGKSKTTTNYFALGGNDFVDIGCYDWTPEMKWWDNLRIGMISNELENFLKVAY